MISTHFPRSRHSPTITTTTIFFISTTVIPSPSRVSSPVKKSQVNKLRLNIRFPETPCQFRQCLRRWNSVRIRGRQRWGCMNWWECVWISTCPVQNANYPVTQIFNHLLYKYSSAFLPFIHTLSLNMNNLTTTRIVLLALLQLSDQSPTHSSVLLNRPRRSARPDLSWTRNAPHGITFLYSNQFCKSQTNSYFNQFKYHTQVV